MSFSKAKEVAFLGVFFHVNLSSFGMLFETQIKSQREKTLFPIEHILEWVHSALYCKGGFQILLQTESLYKSLMLSGHRKPVLLYTGSVHQDLFIYCSHIRLFCSLF